MWKPVRSIFSLNDPGWGRGGQGSDQRPPQRPNNDGPPDLDELWRDFNRRLNGLFRRGGGGSRPPGGNGSEPPSLKGAGAGFGLLLLVAVLLWLASGFYIVQEGQASVVLNMLQHLSPLVAPLDVRLAGLTLQPRGNWVAVLDRGAVIELGQGTPQELAARLTQFVETVKEVTARRQRSLSAVETADLRHVGGYALRMRGVTTVRGDAAGTPAAPVRR